MLRVTAYTALMHMHHAVKIEISVPVERAVKGADFLSCRYVSIISSYRSVF